MSSTYSYFSVGLVRCGSYGGDDRETPSPNWPASTAQLVSELDCIKAYEADSKSVDMI